MCWFFMIVLLLLFFWSENDYQALASLFEPSSQEEWKGGKEILQNTYLKVSLARIHHAPL